MPNSKKQFSALLPMSSHFSESWVSACFSLWSCSQAAAFHSQWKPKAVPDVLLHNSLFSTRLQVHTKFHCRQAHTPGADTSCLSFSYDGVTLASRGGEDNIFLCIVGAMHILQSTKIREPSLSLPACKSSFCRFLNRKWVFLCLVIHCGVFRRQTGVILLKSPSRCIFP